MLGNWTRHNFVDEHSVLKLKLSRLIESLNQIGLISPPLKKLLFEMLKFLLAVVEIVRFLRSLLHCFSNAWLLYFTNSSKTNLGRPQI
jgi:hypothetical protein